MFKHIFIISPFSCEGGFLSHRHAGGISVRGAFWQLAREIRQDHIAIDSFGAYLSISAAELHESRWPSSQQLT